ncbi:YicC/YloC family endoribonuclease [uncultured Roseobacter sp.]|uniref:YicC/YloC family endoribonuclease n=1 Tax=uncultured Roseobacter sp. TaxID=114847 RepID=UPI00261A027C|nr:YicC/YloC family endoribonuclease [uncultured Roseobacter sp.]
MIRSMTGFASATGSLAPHSWTWELRSVNGKGQDLRLRIPEWIDGLEAALRKKLAASSTRGNVTLALRISREETGGGLQINTEQLDAMLAALAEIEARAMDAGVSLAPSRASDLLGQRGVLEQTSTTDDTAALSDALTGEVGSLISAWNDMRAGEGTVLQKILSDQLDQVARLTQEAAALASARTRDMTVALRRNLDRVMENTDAADPDRVAQELAMIAVKADITEEIDRLAAHVTAARDLIAQGGAVGRRLDFLMQEFNREANTLCSKAQNTDLTRCGLALKALIDQMREQVQNVE